MRYAAVFALSVTLLSLLGPRSLSAATISAPFLTVGVGDTFTVQITVTDAVDLASFQFDLAFAPPIVQADEAGATAGTALPADWFFTSPGAVDNTNGDIIGVSVFGSAFGGSGVIASFEFTALSVGVSPLDLSSVFMNFSDQGFDVSDGQITVTGSAHVPEPTTLALFAGGLLFLGACATSKRKSQW